MDWLPRADEVRGEESMVWDEKRDDRRESLQVSKKRKAAHVDTSDPPDDGLLPRRRFNHDLGPLCRRQVELEPDQPPPEFFERRVEFFSSIPVYRKMEKSRCVEK